MTDKSEIIITRVCKIISVGSVNSPRTCTQTRNIAEYKVKSEFKLKLE